MQKHPCITLLCSFATLALLASPSPVKAAEKEEKPAEAKEQKLAKDQIPSAVMTSFQKSYPKAKVKGASQEVEDSVTYIEIESVDGSIKRDVLYRSDGQAMEIEEEVDAKSLPQAAQQALAKDYPKSKVEKSERITRGEKIEYEVLVEAGDVHTELLFDASGKLLKSEVADEDEDED